ncbi:MAG TPA: carboxypeptidase regulatory-like domain-containing protein [Thermoanaerobaculaceae bacterium]|nr:carboxypeptidase regulatory-like domain-containing protein [Thermoanaerobaculaceae bacterium]
MTRLRPIALGIAVSLAVARGPIALAQPAELSAASEPGCGSGIRIEAIEATPDGLRIRAGAPLRVEIASAEEVSRSGLAGYSQLVLTVAGASLAPGAATAAWANGPFASMRATRYLGADGCGVRVRLQPRVSSRWMAQSEATGASLRPAAPAAVAVAQTAPAREGAFAGLAGGGKAGFASVSGYLSASRGDGVPGSSLHNVAVNVAQTLESGARVHAFGSDYGERDLGPYGGVALSGLALGALSGGATIGDLDASSQGIGVADRFGDAMSIGSEFVRGTGAYLVTEGGVGLRAFAGRPLNSQLLRLGGETVTGGEYSDDRVWGLDTEWADSAGTVGLGFGLRRGAPRGASGQTNLVGTLALRRSEDLNARLVVDHSAGDEGGRSLAGYAMTFEPHVRGERVNVQGFVRYASSDYRPALGSTFFANLRHSYNLVASLQASRSLSLAASLTQDKTFSIFDPEQSGSLNGSKSASVAYAVSRAVTLSADASWSSATTDPGVLIPADSRTSDLGGGVAFGGGGFGIAAHAAKERTDNLVSPADGLDSRRLDLQASQSFGRGDVVARLLYLDSHRPDGASAGRNYTTTLGAHSWVGSALTAYGEVGRIVSPAGIALVPSRQSYATLMLQSNRRLSGLDLYGSMTVTYLVADVGGAPRRSGWTVQANLGSLLGWGAGPHLIAPQSSRALTVPEPELGAAALPRLSVGVFEDANANGVWDDGEAGLAGVRIQVGDQVVATDGAGRMQLRLAPGAYTVSIDLRDAPAGYALPQLAQLVAVAPMAHPQVSFAMVPSARLAGRVVAQPSVENHVPISGIRVVARGRSVSRDAVTDERGEFTFMALPAGAYTVSIDAETLAEGIVPVEPAEVAVTLAKGDRREIELTIRRATARERFGPGGGGGSGGMRNNRANRTRR